MDRRVYDGVPNNELQTYLEYVIDKETEMKIKFPESSITYFPMEGKYMAHIWGEPLSNMHNSKLGAILEALTK